MKCEVFMNSYKKKLKMNKKLLLCSLFASALLLVGCGNSEDPKKETSEKIKLEFKPVSGKQIKMNYQFSVNQVTSGELTAFEIEMSGRGGTNENGEIVLDFKNDKIKMSGNIQGVTVSGSASGPDSLTGDAKLVALPIFTLEGNTYRSTYDSHLNKKNEVRISDGAIVDSTENKMQFLIRYPNQEIAVGDTWDKEIVIKSGNKMNCSAKYTLKEIHGDFAVISMEGKLYGSGDKFGNEYTMEGKLTGTITVDITTGWPIDSETHQDFILKMGGKDIPMKYDIKCKAE